MFFWKKLNPPPPLQLIMPINIGIKEFNTVICLFFNKHISY